MQKINDHFTEIIDITLYRYNSIDLKLWGIISRDNKSKNMTPNSMLVSKERMEVYLNAKFTNDVNRFRTVSDVNIHKEATSIYFIWQIFQSMPNLSYIRVNLNSNASYNRIVKVDQVKTIKYDIKTLRGSMRMFDLFHEEHELKQANNILIKAGLFKEQEAFKIFKLRDFLSALDLFQAEHNTVEVLGVTNAFIHVLEHHENDNPDMLLITDWESDI
jgi:hypothetical protein|tara:strand:- start:831 stop:1481 length:651 start_codon:yes stop_codon:yes gene_type:complete